MKKKTVKVCEHPERCNHKWCHPSPEKQRLDRGMNMIKDNLNLSSKVLFLQKQDSDAKLRALSFEQGREVGFREGQDWNRAYGEGYIVALKKVLSYADKDIGEHGDKEQAWVSLIKYIGQLAMDTENI